MGEVLEPAPVDMAEDRVVGEQRPPYPFSCSSLHRYSIGTRRLDNATALSRREPTMALAPPMGTAG